MRRITRISLALLSGLLMAAAWPTNGFAPLIFVAFVPLIYLQDRIGCQQLCSRQNNESTGQQGKGSVFGLSFLTFLVWNTLTTWWVWNSTPAGAIAMLLLNSALMAFFFWLYHFTRKNVFKNKNGFFLLILCFLSFENLHYNWQLNWPWLTLGNVFSHNHTWVQWYEFTGVAGGTIWVLMSNIVAYKIIKGLQDNKSIRQQVSMIAIFLALVVAPIVVSKIMYNSYEEKGEKVEVVVVQPNIDPWNEEFSLSSREILMRNFDLAIPLMTENTRFVVSPESSIHESIWLDKVDSYFSIRNLKRFSNKYNDVAYVIGASTLGLMPEGQEVDFAARKFYDADEYFYAYNTAFLVADSLDVQWHQKSRLTPGVEMMPSWWFLRPLSKLAIDLGGTVGTLKTEDAATILTYRKQRDNETTRQQEVSSTLQSHDSDSQYYKIAPMICYESVFGGYVTEFVREGANIIFVITNDGWWGNTPGHRQHFEMSKLRAIENRRSIARSANTGISGFINQRGDVIEQTKYWEPDALRTELTLNEEMTFYSQHGDYLYRIGTFVAILVLCFSVVTSILRRKV
mgnify:CR=1 FL=1